MSTARGGPLTARSRGPLLAATAGKTAQGGHWARAGNSGERLAGWRPGSNARRTSLAQHWTLSQDTQQGTPKELTSTLPEPSSSEELGLWGVSFRSAHPGKPQRNPCTTIE
eukprot:9491500-Pyramimonas_sp.AAC.1